MVEHEHNFMIIIILCIRTRKREILADSQNNITKFLFRALKHLALNANQNNMTDTADLMIARLKVKLSGDTNTML